jgi:hypothetical protein
MHRIMGMMEMGANRMLIHNQDQGSTTKKIQETRIQQRKRRRQRKRKHRLEQQNPEETRKKKKTIHRKDSTLKAITFTTFKPVGSTEPPEETIFDPTVMSDEQMMDLYNEVSKEVTNRWKRASRDDTRLAARKNKEKQVLKDVVLLAKEKLDIDQPTEGIDPLAAMKHLIEAVISTGANNQAEIQHLRQENKELKQLHNRALRNNQDGLAQQTTTILQSSLRNLKRYVKN